MNNILLIGFHGDGPPGLFLVFLLIFISGSFYYSWKRHKKIAQEGETKLNDINYWKPRIIVLIAVLTGLFLPLIRTLIEQNRIGIIRGGDYLNDSFDVYSSQAFLNLILFFLIPFLISAIIMVFKKEFPIRVFNKLVMIIMVFVSFMTIITSFHHRI